ALCRLWAGAGRGVLCPRVAVGPGTAQVLVGKSAAIQIQVLVILRLWEFDSPRPHSFSVLASESAKAESQTARCGHSADTFPLAERVRDLRRFRTRDGLWLRVVSGGHGEAFVTERCR